MDRDEKGEDQIKAVGFAAGMAACMACIQRAIVVSVFVHWRVWAFLALNLLLLAILFISKFQRNMADQETGDSSDLKKEKKTRQDQCGAPQILTGGGGEKAVELEKCDDNHNHVAEETAKVNEEEEEEEEEDGANKEDCECDEELSKEELHQRVEAFIAMFRQHLVCDAKGKSYGSLR